MPLTNKTINQFVKATKNDTESTKKETIVYGKITSFDETNKTCYVQLDGSDREIPVTRYTAEVKEGERVTVMIKNHIAVVTGNLESPSVSENTVNTTVRKRVSESIAPIDIAFIDSLFTE